MTDRQEHCDSFFVSFRPLLWLGQFCGVLPLMGTVGKTHYNLAFSWKNWQICYCLVLFVVTFFFNVVSTVENVSMGIHIDSFGWTMFYSVCNINIILFIGLARQFPNICTEMVKLEKHLLHYGYPKSIHLQTKYFIYVFLFLSICEHSLLTFLNCVATIQDTQLSNVTFLEAFSSVRFPIITKWVGHSDSMTVFVFLVHVIETLNWNYLDFFLAALSMQISGKLGQFNHTLQYFALQNKDQSFWSKLCKDYNRMSVFTKSLDSKVSNLVLMSFISNFYHVSLQLIRSVKLKGSNYEMAYFYFSLGYLITRMMSVSLFGAKIEEESRRAKLFLHSLQDPCPAAVRLLKQVNTDNICLSGGGFFSLNRSFIFKMVGTLVTYEVILVQLNALKYNDAINKSENSS